MIITLSDLVIIVNIIIGVFVAMSEIRRRQHQDKESDSSALNTMTTAASTLTKSTLDLLSAKDQDLDDAEQIIFEKKQRIICLEKYIRQNGLPLPDCTGRLTGKLENKDSTKQL